MCMLTHTGGRERERERERLGGGGGLIVDKDSFGSTKMQARVIYKMILPWLGSTTKVVGSTMASK